MVRKLFEFLMGNLKYTKEISEKEEKSPYYNLLIILLLILIIFIINIFYIYFNPNDSNNIIYIQLLGAISTFFLVFITVLSQFDNQKRESIPKVKPHLLLERDDDGNYYLALRITNIGRGVAYKISFRDVTPIGPNGYPFSKINFMEHGIKYLTPNDYIQKPLFYVSEAHDKYIGISISFKIIYFDMSDKLYVEPNVTFDVISYL